MHICHLTSVHPAKDIRIFHKECKSLVEKGFKVSLIAPNIEDHTFEGVDFFGVQNKSKSRIYRFIFVTQRVYYKAISLNADVYHFHDPELLRIGLMLKRKNKKVIFDAHENVALQILSKHWINPTLSKLLSKIYNYYEKFACRKLDYIITATSIIRDKFIKAGSRAIDINNFPRLNEFNVMQDWSKKEDELCYIGGISKVRGIFETVEVLGKYKLNLAGLFSPPELKEILEKHKNWKYVNLYGFVGRVEVEKILNKSKIGIVTLHPTKNNKEIQPIKLFEYMMAGIPVIASNFPLWKDIVEKYNCGICVDPLDKEEIAKTIDFLMENPEIAIKMGKNGREAVENNFSWETEEMKLIRIYQNLI